MKTVFPLLILLITGTLTVHTVTSQETQAPAPTSEGMVLISAGPFRMGVGEKKLAGDAAKPIHLVTLDAFYIDTHEVTVGEYKRFIEATGHRKLPKIVAELSPTDLHPVVAVTWHDAMAYATWAGKRLPTEAEWEKAARGGLLDKDYPWGNDEPDSSRANCQKMVRAKTAVGEDPPKMRATTAPVGEYPPNAFGLYDVAGNVAEWCLDAWNEDFYSHSPEENPFAGPKSRDTTLEDFQTIKGLRVVRGGAWNSMSPGTLMVGGRNKGDAVKKYGYIGFRCAKDALP